VSRIFSSLCRPDRLWGPPNLLSNGCRGALSLEVKWPVREADHSPPTSAEVKKIWIYTFIPPLSFTGITLPLRMDYSFCLRGRWDAARKGLRITELFCVVMTNVLLGSENM
jgi:hypothetical protein